MRRVVVTGMGIACPLGLGVEHVWRRLINGESGISRHPVLRHQGPACKVAGQVPPGTRAEGGLDISELVPVKDQKKMDRFIHLAMVAGDRGGGGFRLDARGPRTDRSATGVMIGSGIGGLQTIYEAAVMVHEGKARRLSPFFIPSALINLALRPSFDQIRLQGPEPRGRDRLRHRRARDRRRGPADHAGRRRRDGRRRRRGGGVRARHRRLLRLARPVHRVQRPPDASVAPVGQGPRRLRDGRGRRRRGAGGAGAREAARREDLRRGRRLRHVRRRLSHHRPGRGP